MLPQSLSLPQPLEISASTPCYATTNLLLVQSALWDGLGVMTLALRGGEAGWVGNRAHYTKQGILTLLFIIHDKTICFRKCLAVLVCAKPGSHLCDKHNTSDISISTRKKEHVSFSLCLCLCLCRLCYAYRTSVNQALRTKAICSRSVRRLVSVSRLYDR